MGLLRAIWLLVKLDFRDRYSSLWAFVGELAALTLGLFIYNYTAKAFAPALGAQAQDYFSFILVGELALLVPLQLLENMTRNIKQLVAQGTIDPLLLLPFRPQLTPVLLSLASVPRELARIALTIVIACAVFDVELGARSLAQAALLQATALPAFLGLAMLACAVVVGLGRGYGLLAYMMTGAAVLAGAYFPTSVLPIELQHAGALSPFTALLEATRLSIAGGGAGLGPLLWSLAKWGGVLLPVGYLSLGLSLCYLRKRGEPLLVTV